jgi:cytochrome oxidase Cu insertion factor (SCO1/SenC/PrrC family)
MRKTPSVALLAALLLALVVPSLSFAQGNMPAPPPLKLKVGDPAPEFTLRDQNGKEVSLKDFKGKKTVILAFFVFAFTGG